MGTNKSPSDVSKSAATPRPLWQVPVFIAGVAALACAWVTRAPVDSGPRQVARHLAKARQSLSRPDGDAEAAAKEAQLALDACGPEGDRAGEANFLLGSACMRQGDHAPGGDGRALWMQSRQYLEAAERLGVPKEDQGHLHYRLAKVCFHTGDEPGRVAKLLADAAPDAEDGAEAYDLLSQAYLRLTPPDYAKALEANTKLREQSILQVDMLARVQLRSGELKLKLGRIEEARKDLELINPAAPATVICRARVLRARSYHEESKWGEAATLWQEALSEKREPLANRAEVLYLLGVCHQHLEQADEAVRAWDECIHAGDATAEGVAAAVQLAELCLKRKEYPRALELLAATAARVQKPGEWNNAYVDRTRAVEIYERAFATLRGAGQFELALQLTGDYERMTGAGKATGLRAEIATEWARQRKAKAGDGKLAPEEERAAHDLLAKAGDAFIEAAATAGTEGAADLLWQAAGRFVEAQDLPRAVTTLERFLKDEQRPDRCGEGWFLLGEVQRLSKNTDAAEQAYVTCVKFQSPFACRARYELALLYWQAGKADEARDVLGENLKQLRFDNDTATIQKSLYAMGNFAFQRHDYAEVVKRLEEALNQTKDAKETPDHTRARYQLAESYRRLANEAKRDELIGASPNPEYVNHLRQKHRTYLEKAADEYQELAADLEKPEATSDLTEREREEMPLVAADLRYQLGQYQKALLLYDRLADGKSGPKALTALGGSARCHYALGQRDKLSQRVDDIRKALAGADEAVRADWDAWLSRAARQPAAQ